MKLVISLSGVSDMSLQERASAERRYLDVLEEVFGGADAVWMRLQAAQQAKADGSGGPAEMRAISRWEQAELVASNLALGGRQWTGTPTFTVSNTPS